MYTAEKTFKAGPQHFLKFASRYLDGYSNFKIETFKGLVNLQKTFFKFLLIEKPVMRETECRKPHQKIQNSYKVMKV